MIRLGIVSDLHWASGSHASASWHNEFDFDGVPERLRSALTYFRQAHANAVVIAGDLSQDGDLASTKAVLAAVKDGWPGLVLAVNGNHECIETDDQLDRALGTEGHFLDVRGTRVKDVAIAGVPIECEGGVFSRLRGSEADAKWPAGPRVVISHYPLLSQAARLSCHGYPYPGDLIGGSTLAERLAEDREPTVAISGHIHARTSSSKGALLQLTLGALVEPPFECALIELSSGGSEVVTCRRTSKRLGPSNAVHDPVFSADSESWEYEGSWRLRS
jgi:predicted phosphodiesterase